MAAHLIESLWVTGYGASAASGYAYFYQPNTLTPVSVYSNDLATTVVTQPVRLDANGRSSAPLYVKVPARAIIQNSSGATLIDIERIDGDRTELVANANVLWPNEASQDAINTAIATSLGGTDGNFRGAGSGAVLRTVQSKMSEAVSVKDFGAVGNGTADDTGPIQAASNYVTSLGGGTLRFPAGTYLISSPITIGVAGALIKGDGAAASIVKNSSTTGNAFTIGAFNGVIFEDLAVTASTTSTGTAIAQGGTLGYYSRLTITNHRTGISGLAGTVLSCSVTTDGNSASIGLLSTGTTSVIQSAISVVAVGGGCPIKFNTGTINGNVIACALTGCTTSAPTPTAIWYASANTVQGIIIGTSATVGQILLDGATGIFTYGFTSPNAVAMTDNINSWQFSVAGGNSCQPLVANWKTFKVIGSSAGTVTVLYSSSTFREEQVRYICSNQSGGAVTFSFGGQFRLSAAVSPADTFSIVISFVYDPTGAGGIGIFREISRSAATAN